MDKQQATLAKVERIVRNLPVTGIEYNYLDTKSGRVYAAAGRDSTDRYHGVWAFVRDPAMAQVVVFEPGQVKSLVFKELFEQGCQALVEMDARGLLRDGIKFTQ